MLVVGAGSIPRQLGNLTALMSLEVYNNGLTGEGMFSEKYESVRSRGSAPSVLHAFILIASSSSMSHDVCLVGCRCLRTPWSHGIWGNRYKSVVSVSRFSLSGLQALLVSFLYTGAGSLHGVQDDGVPPSPFRLCVLIIRTRAEHRF